MASDIEQAHLLLKAEQENPGKVFVGYTERWNPAVDVLRTQLPMIGDIRHVTISRLGLEPRCPDTGPALDLLTHDVDLLRYLELWPRLLHSVNDGGHITASFSLASGSATLQASHLHPVKRRTMTVLGECGMLTVDLQAQSVTYADQHGVLVLDVPHREPLERQHLALLQGQGVTTSEALINLKVALRAQLPERLTL
jgi:predicted dehydrogenase